MGQREELRLLNTAGHALKLPSTPGSGQNTQALRWNNATQAFEFFTPGGTSDHAALTSNLSWATSGHIATGSATQLAGFNASNAAVLVARGTLKANDAIPQADAAGRFPDWMIQGACWEVLQTQIRAITGGTFATQFQTAVTRQGTSFSNITDAQAYWTQCQPVSGNGNLAGFRSGANVDVHLGFDWYVAGRFRIPTDIDAMRIFIGLNEANPTNADDQAGKGAYLLFTAGTHTNWQIATDDGTTQDLDDTGIAPAADTVYELTMYQRAGTLYWNLNGTTGSKTTNVPSGNTMAGIHANVWNIGAVQREIQVDSFSVVSFR